MKLLFDIFQKDKINKYQVPKSEDKIIVNNKRYIDAEEKEPFVAKPVDNSNKPQAAKPLYAWANQEQQAHRDQYVSLVFLVETHV